MKRLTEEKVTKEITIIKENYCKIIDTLRTLNKSQPLQQKISLWIGLLEKEGTIPKSLKFSKKTKRSKSFLSWLFSNTEY
jgi:hypothetical protein